jgi:hypothetical protein
MKARWRDQGAEPGDQIEWVELIWSSRSDIVHPLRDGFDIVITKQRVAQVRSSHTLGNHVRMTPYPQRCRRRTSHSTR